MAADSVGYSGTPLVEKLGLKPGMRVRLLDAPDHYWDLLGGGPSDLDLEPAGTGAGEAEFVHLFAVDRTSLDRYFAVARAAMATNGMVWASWPKKSSGVTTEIARGDVMAAGKEVGLVDVKVCAVDETWSGLKFVVPVEDR